MATEHSPTHLEISCNLFGEHRTAVGGQSGSHLNNAAGCGNEVQCVLPSSSSKWFLSPQTLFPSGRGDPSVSTL